MGIMQQAVLTYDLAEKQYAGVYYENMAEPLAPVSHLITKADIEIFIDNNGLFVEAKKVQKGREKTLFPVTVESANRAATAAAEHPHPLCESLKYISPNNTISIEVYLGQLSEWESSEYTHPMLFPILKYVQKGTIIKDLELSGFEIDEKFNPFIRWQVLNIGEESGPCWTNRTLQKKYIDFYFDKVVNFKSDICMVTGENTSISKFHIKGIVPKFGNAKLLSSNDKANFTYRGRFCSDEDALTVGYLSSQKAHNALKWVIQNQGTVISGRCFVCWNPQGKEIPKPTGVLRRKTGKESEAIYSPTEYRQQLRNTLNSWKDSFPGDEKAVTAVFDAATSGRLALAYYSELSAKDFIDRLGYWDETCCWINGSFGIQAPPLTKVITYSYGTLRGSVIEANDDIAKQMLLKLTACRIEKSLMPKDTLYALVKKAGNLILYPDDSKSKYLRRDLLYVTCAVIKKYRKDHYKEEWDMALEPEKKDRSYQYGRLLAVLEKEERDTYKVDENREPNALRMQTVFTQRPLYASRKLTEQIKRAYFKRLSPAQQTYYERLTGQIMDQLSLFEEDANKPLEDTYLLGYYLQRNSMYTKKTDNNDSEGKETEEE